MIGITLLTGSGAISGFSAACAAGGCGVLSCFDGSDMIDFMPSDICFGVTCGAPTAGVGDALGVTIDATGNGGADCAGAGFGGSGGLTG